MLTWRTLGPVSCLPSRRIFRLHQAVFFGGCRVVQPAFIRDCSLTGRSLRGEKPLADLCELFCVCVCVCVRACVAVTSLDGILGMLVAESASGDS